MLEPLSEDECLRLISPGGVGRIAFTGRFGLSIFPVNYKVHDGSIVFRTAGDSPFGEDLRTGIRYAGYKVAFEIDQVDAAAREGWSGLIQGQAHHMDTSAERALAQEIDVEPWAGGKRDDAAPVSSRWTAGRTPAATLDPSPLSWALR